MNANKAKFFVMFSGKNLALLHHQIVTQSNLILSSVILSFSLFHGHLYLGEESLSTIGGFMHDQEEREETSTFIFHVQLF